MNTVIIDDVNTCCSAVIWCQSNIPEEEWTLSMSWPADSYTFEFADSKWATMFNLKWAGTVDFLNVS